jgi:hypothetical protein
MPDGALPLIIGTLLALTALSYVLLPLLLNADEGAARAKAPPVRARDTVPEEQLAVVALREIEFDRETGKLSDADYADLKAKYSELAVSELRAANARPARDNATMVAAAALAQGEDPVEAAVRAVQARRPSCRSCGPRPESDAIWCSGCGSYLPGACQSCGADVTMPGARFCNACGVTLAA